MKLEISRLKRKEIETKKGTAELLNFNAGGKWYSCFAGSWNEDWQNGMEVDVDQSQIETVEKNGKTFTNILAPSKSKNAKSSGNPDFEKRVIEALKVIYRDLQVIKQKLGIDQDGE